MTIKKWLAVSNVLMLLVPIGISVLIALCRLGVIWFMIAHGTGVWFEDSEDFIHASAGISELASDALTEGTTDEQMNSLKTLTSILDRGAMSLIFTIIKEVTSYSQTAILQYALNAEILLTLLVCMTLGAAVSFRGARTTHWRACSSRRYRNSRSPSLNTWAFSSSA